jgi:hypothetical protein
MKFKRILACLGLLALVSFAFSDSDLNEKSQAAFDVDKRVGDWVAMWNSYDLNEVDRLFVTDDRLTYLSSEKEGALQGIDAIRDHHRGFGFVEGGKEQPDGSLQRGPMTIVYLRESEEYRIVHMHFANYLDED